MSPRRKPGPTAAGGYRRSPYDLLFTRYSAQARQFADFREPPLKLHLSLAPLISLIAGILILVMPKLLNYIVAIYLIAIGVIGLLGLGSLRLH